VSLLCGPWCGDRIPREMMHKVPTSLLHSLEGMSDLDWESLLKLQSQDGSFLFSPSSTAFALMQTKDQNCHNYLNRMVKRFNGGGKFSLFSLLHIYNTIYFFLITLLFHFSLPFPSFLFIICISYQSFKQSFVSILSANMECL